MFKCVTPVLCVMHALLTQTKKTIFVDIKLKVAGLIKVQYVRLLCTYITSRLPYDNLTQDLEIDIV